MSHRNFWTTYMGTFRTSTLILLDRPLWHFRTVPFDIFGPSTFILRFIWTVHFESNDRPVWLKTVYFWIDRPISCDRPLSLIWTVHFFTTVAWTWTRLFFRNRGVYMDVDTEIFENCGVDMDTAWNRCPPNSDGQYNIESNLENGGYIQG